MKRVALQAIDMTNFKSFLIGHIDLRRDPGMRLIFGENQCEPRLGANGAGKSSIWDGVCFCLTGRSVRGRRASELVSTGEKTTAVETTWSIDNDVRTIKRTAPPERIYIDGELCTQDAIDKLIGLTRDRLLHSVLFGQAKPLFIDLPVPERGDLLDEVLGLGFWMRSADLATAKWNAAGVEMQKVQRELAWLDGALAELPSEDSLQRIVADWALQRARQIGELKANRVSLVAAYRHLRQSLDAGKDAVEQEDKVRGLYDASRNRLIGERSAIAVLQTEVRRLQKDIDFFEQTGECPTCGQEISSAFADQHVGDLMRDYKKKTGLLDEAIKKEDRTNQHLADLTVELRSLGEQNRQQHALSLSVTSKRGEINGVDNRIKLLLDQANPYEEQLVRQRARRAQLDEQLAGKHAEESALSVRLEQLGFWRQGFRRVRVFCLTRVLAELEIETMSAARSLGLEGWRIGYSGETELKSGSVKLGVQVVVQTPGVSRDFDNLSPGEAQRVRLSSALGLGSLIQRYSGVLYDIEILDEPSAWLSSQGIEDLFESLQERAHARQKAIWVCDPRAGLAHGGFDEVLNVIKDENGSRIEVVRGAVSRGSA